MARPTKEGLEYFSLDVDILGDDKIKIIKAKHGLAGFAIIILLLTKIYNNGYYYKWTEDEQYLFSDDTKTDINVVINIVNDCINKGFFHRSLYDQYEILTSRGIQKRYLQGVIRRKNIILIREYFIADDHLSTLKITTPKFTPTFTSINANINSISADIMLAETPQSKVKESKEKVKESKVKEMDTETASVFSLFQNEIGIVSSVLADKLADDIEHYSAVWVREAIKIAVSKGKRNLDYAEGILSNWKANGYNPDQQPWSIEKRQKEISSDNGSKPSGNSILSMAENVKRRLANGSR